MHPVRGVAWRAKPARERALIQPTPPLVAGQGLDFDELEAVSCRMVEDTPLHQNEVCKLGVVSRHSASLPTTPNNHTVVSQMTAVPCAFARTD